MSDNNCALCRENVAKYMCPRCNLPYCSVDCYKLPIHSLCSEAFYKNCIEEEMKISDHDPEVKRKMMDILKKNQDLYSNELDESDSDDETDLETRLSGINLNDPTEIWQRLSIEEQTEFLDMARTGDVSSLIPTWDPWWNLRKGHTKVVDLDESVNCNEFDCPPIKPAIPLLSDLPVPKPSPLVFNNLINVLAAYALMCRFFNGDHSSSADESSGVLLKISKNLSSNHNFETIESAISSVSLESINYEVIRASDENIYLMTSDVSKILLGPCDQHASNYVLSALSDIHSVLSKGKITAKTGVKVPLQSNLPPVFYDKIINTSNNKQFILALKKIEYYLSWVQSCYNDIFSHVKVMFPN